MSSTLTVNQTQPSTDQYAAEAHAGASTAAVKGRPDSVASRREKRGPGRTLGGSLETHTGTSSDTSTASGASDKPPVGKAQASSAVARPIPVPSSTDTPPSRPSTNNVNSASHEAKASTSTTPVQLTVTSQTSVPFEGHQQTWVGTGSDTVGAQEIAKRFAAATEVLQKLVKQRKELESGTDISLSADLRQAQQREGFSDAFLTDATSLSELAKSMTATKALRSILKTGRKSKIDRYHRSVTSGEIYKAILSSKNTFRDSGLKDDDEKTVTDILWRNDQTALRLLGKMIENRGAQTEETKPTESVHDRLQPYVRPGYEIGDGGYDQEVSQIAADLSGRLTSQPAARRSARPEQLSALKGYNLVTAIGELSRTMSEKHLVEGYELRGIGNNIPALIKRYRRGYRKEHGLSDTTPLDSDAEDAVRRTTKSLMWSHLHNVQGWDDPSDAETMMAIWTVEDETARILGLNSMVAHASSQSERGQAKAEGTLAQIEQELSLFDDPYRKSGETVARWRR